MIDIDDWTAMRNTGWPSEVKTQLAITDPVIVPGPAPAPAPGPDPAPGPAPDPAPGPAPGPDPTPVPDQDGTLTITRGMDSVSLQKFPLERIVTAVRTDKQKAHTLLVGGSGGGKSTVLKDVLQAVAPFVHARPIASSAEHDDAFFSKFCEPGVLTITDDGEEVEEKLEELYELAEFKPDDTEKKIFCVPVEDLMDECKAANIWEPNKIGRKILIKGRKRNFFLLVVIQNPKGVPPVVRTNMRFIVLTGGGQTSADQLYDEYLSAFFGSSHNPKAFFKRVFAAVTAVRGRVIMVDTQPPFDAENPDRAHGLSDHMYWYRADSADLPPPDTLKMEPTVSPAVLDSGDDVQAEAEEDAQVTDGDDELLNNDVIAGEDVWKQAMETAEARAQVGKSVYTHLSRTDQPLRCRSFWPSCRRRRASWRRRRASCRRQRTRRRRRMSCESWRTSTEARTCCTR